MVQYTIHLHVIAFIFISCFYFIQVGTLPYECFLACCVFYVFVCAFIVLRRVSSVRTVCTFCFMRNKRMTMTVDHMQKLISRINQPILVPRHDSGSELFVCDNKLRRSRQQYKHTHSATMLSMHPMFVHGMQWHQWTENITTPPCWRYTWRKQIMR